MLSLFFILSVLLFPSISFSQTIVNQTPIDGISISINPETPAPNREAVIKVESFNTDLNSASIVWSIDGKVVSKGIGITTLTIISPPIGKISNIISTILTVEGREIRKGINVKSSDIDLVWESAGFIPPFYRGKSLFSYQNQVKIVAMPHMQGVGGKEADPKTLSYKWTVNDKVMTNQSGYGKQTLLIKDDLPVDLDVKVEIMSRDGNQKSIATMKLTPGDPSLVFYEEDPLYGVLYNKALVEDVRLKNNEIGLIAVPYYFTKKSSSDISRVWSINDIEQSGLKNNESITLRAKDNSEGSSQLSLEIRGIDNLLQGAKGSVNILFNKKINNDNQTF